MELIINTKLKGCGICGGKMVYIRGKYPKDPKRKICPTCAQETLEDIIQRVNPEYNKQSKEISKII